MVYYHILDLEKQVLASNFPEFLIDEIYTWKAKTELVNCNSFKQKRRQKKINTSTYELFLCTYKESLSNKKFSIYLEACKFFADDIFKKYNKAKESEVRKTKRLKHNLSTLSANINQELYTLIPHESLIRGRRNQLDYIKKIIQRDANSAAQTVLRVLKFSNLMKAEFDVYDMLNTSTPNLDFYEHKIHKITLLTLNAFWFEIFSQGVEIKVDDCEERVIADYKSLFVIFSHIFDNTTKYIAPNSTFHISFENLSSVVRIKFDMISLKVEQDEVSKVFNETYSGKWTTKIDKAGDGIGLYIVKKLILLNEGAIEFITDVDINKRRIINGVPYENNQILVEIKKA